MGLLPVDVFQLRVEIKELDEAAPRLEAAAENESAGLKNWSSAMFQDTGLDAIKEIVLFLSPGCVLRISVLKAITHNS